MPDEIELTEDMLHEMQDACCGEYEHCDSHCTFCLFNDAARFKKWLRDELNKGE